MARAAKKAWKVTVGNTGQVISCRPDETILHAAVIAGIDYPYACASGNCGQCLSKIESGTVTMLPRGDASLSPEQANAGMALACRAQPKGDVSLTWLGRGRK
jgi:naphthalene 1,2-dioxygenase ferredoxin reductase component